MVADKIVVEFAKVSARWVMGLIVHANSSVAVSKCDISILSSTASELLLGLSYDINGTTTVEDTYVILNDISAEWIAGVVHQPNAVTSITNSHVTLSNFNCSNYINGIFRETQSELSIDNVTVSFVSGSGNHVNGFGEMI